jgi:hypothetical protein
MGSIKVSLRHGGDDAVHCMEQHASLWKQLAYDKIING